ncbi:uncharacterized protein LOC117296291 [Asterias rubens]|uniref:uncharacterized protein LOC117296291 n=1 Tax=Asterias rubens TaxID=7604 RepID=UPI00145529F4|nr:uncharacterized protein LOC117296291 [Asterias rubens]
MPPTSRGKGKLRGRGRKLFMGQSSFERHYDAHGKNRDKYVAILTVLRRSGVELSLATKTHALASAWAHNDHDLVDSLLANSKEFGLVEILKAATMLDSGRKIREWEKKLKLQEMNPKKGQSRQRRAVAKIKVAIKNLIIYKPKFGSLSGSVARRIKQWASSISTVNLEFFALHLPKEPWKKLSDLVHFNPEKDFANLPWFLPFCYGKRAPIDSMVQNCSRMTHTNVNGLLLLYNVPYAHVKTFKDSLNEESKELISRREAMLDTLLWYYEDLCCPAVDMVIEERLRADEPVNLPYGKLMERLLTIKVMREEKLKSERKVVATFYHLLLPIAERRLLEIKMSIDAPVVVIGDRSQSMAIAVQTSTIIASLICAIAKAELCFFNRTNHHPPVMPRTIEEVLHLATTLSAVGGTAPAASLLPYYTEKKVCKTFIMVTDEEENDPIFIDFNRYFFADLFERYHKEVYPARLVFISFLKQQHTTGKMVKKLQAKGFKPLQFHLDDQRPDLLKLSNLLGTLASESEDFNDRVVEVESELQIEGTKKAMAKLVV